MPRVGLRGIPQRRRWRHKASGIPHAGTRNHLERKFTVTAPNTKWVTDITYIRTAEHCGESVKALENLIPGTMEGESREVLASEVG
jgi:transposase InsO family protein